jgi:thioesterase domain-containing protein
VTLAQINSEIQILRQSLSRTMAALDEIKVAANKERDLSIPFNTFDKSWSDLEAQTEKVRQHGTAARARVREHWEAWHAEITGLQNQKVREKAQKRYAVTSKEFEKINDKVADAKEVFAPLAADLKDIHTYLQSDLSRAAVSALSGNIWKMGGQARAVDSKLEEVCKQIERAMKKMPSAQAGA